MLGFLFGTLCLFGLAGVVGGAGRGWRHGGRGCGHHGRFGGHHRWEGGPRGPFGEGPASAGYARAVGEVIKRRLRIDDDQEHLVDHALADLRAAVAELVRVGKDSRRAVADAFRGETVDDAALAAEFARHDEAIARARKDVVSSLKQIHAVLDDEQRERAAEWLASGDGRWA